MLKTKLITLFIFLIPVIAFGQQFYNGVPNSLPTIAHPTNVSTAPFIVNQTRSDTMVVTGLSLGSSYFGQVNGVDINHPFVVYYNGTNGAGIGIENCHYIKVIGLSGATLNGGGTNGYVKGLVDYVQVSGFLNLDGLNGGWWLKLESPQSCDYAPNQLNYLNGLASNTVIRNRMLHIWFTHNQIGNSDGSHSCGGEGVYAISTGAYGRDPVPCLSNVIYKPLWGGFFHIDSNKIYNCGRSAIQLSGCDTGYSTIFGNIIRHAGRELNSTQGAGIRTGYGTNNVTEIAYNDIDYTYLYNLDIETGAYVHDNVMNNAGWYNSTTKNPQQIPSVICYASLPNSILKLQYNTAGVNSAQPSTNFAIYGGANYATSGNKVCNNTGNVAVLSLPFNYTTDCGAVDTICVTRDTSYYIDADTTFHFDTTFGYKDTSIMVSHVFKQSQIKHGKTINYYRDGYQDSTIKYIIRPAYDSVGICSLCKLVDSSYKICTPSVTSYGVFIPNNDSITTKPQKAHQAKVIGVNWIRDAYTAPNSYNISPYIDSGLNVTLTYNWADASMDIPAPFPTAAQYPQMGKTFDSILAIKKPQRISWLNEPILFYTYNGIDTSYLARAQEYIASLAYIVPHAHAASLPISDGGELFGIVYYQAKYYNSRGYTDSLNLLSTLSGISTNNLLNTQFAHDQQDFYGYLFANIRSTGVDAFNLHWYEWFSVTGISNNYASGLLPLVANFCQAQTGLPVITDETGTRNNSLTQFNQMFTEWRQYNASLIIYYDGNGTLARANEQYFIDFIRNNP